MLQRLRKRQQKSKHESGRERERWRAAWRVSASESEKDRANESDSVSVNPSVTFIPVDVGNDTEQCGVRQGWKWRSEFLIKSMLSASV